MTAILGRILVLPVVLPPEGPADHIRNALAILRGLEYLNPATWQMNPSLGRAAQRADAALRLLDMSAHYAPTIHAARQLRAAIAALAATDLDWEVVEDVPAVGALLLSALFLVDAM